MNQILGDYDAFLFPFILSHPLHFVPLSSSGTSSVAKSWGLASAVSSPHSGCERSPAAKHIKCILLCIITFNEQLKQSLLNKYTT